jgi:hypothetical protein
MCRLSIYVASGFTPAEVGAYDSYVSVAAEGCDRSRSKENGRAEALPFCDCDEVGD